MTSANNKNVSDEMLMALADGELTGPDASRLLARIKANPDLAIRYALFTDTADALRQAMDPDRAAPASGRWCRDRAATPLDPRGDARDHRPAAAGTRRIPGRMACHLA